MFFDSLYRCSRRLQISQCASSNMEERFLPFVRDDLYGEGGFAPQHLNTRIRLRIMSIVLLPARALGCFACVLSFYIFCRLVHLFPDGRLVRHAVAFWGKFWCRACLLSLGFVSVRWVRLGDRPSQQQQRRQQRQCVAIVANHVSWVDILVMMARHFPSFVARDGTQNLPLIGLISRKMQCLYVDRDKRDPTVSAGGGATVQQGTANSHASATNAASTTAATASSGNGGGDGGGVVAQGVAAAVKQRMLHCTAHPEEAFRPMLLFPEGTTTNGRMLLPFKTGAFLAGVPVQPVVIRYGKGRFSVSWESIGAKDHLFYIGTHLLHSVTCYELPVYTPSSEEVADPKLYAANVRAYMVKYTKLKPSEATMADKRAYQQQLKDRHENGLL